MFQLLAQTTSQGVKTNIAKEITALNFFQQDIGIFVTRLVEVAMIGGAILLLIFLIWGAIDWIGSSGDKTKYEGARNKITHAILGMAILACVWALWQAVNYFLGINKVFNRGGAPSSISTSTESNNDCWPFTSCEAWRAEFENQHGQAPNEQDEAAFRESQDYARQSGQSLTPEDWQRQYEEGHWPN